MKIKFTRENIALLFILILSAVLNFANLGIEGYSNAYYAAGVKSMTLSFKNFFFVSFDPGSFVSIDKPPLGFWLQAVSAKIFGFSGWSILLPQALAGVISVFLIYVIVKRSFGKAAALISALALAVTPVFVAVSRNNTIDNLLVMVLLFACLALLKAAEKGKLKLLILSMVFIGLGFNIKMLQAYMVIPAVYVTYLLASNISFKNRIKHLVIGTVILLVVSLSWTVVVDLVPASQRPFVGSSTNNTVMELIIGHNGLERLGLSGANGGGSRTGGGPGGQMPSSNQQNQPPQGGGQQDGQMPPGNGQQGGPQDGGNGGMMAPPSGQSSSSSSKSGNGMMAPPSSNFRGMDGNRGNRKAGGMGGSFGGQETASITRLFSNNSLSDQISWLLPIAFIGFAVAAFRQKLKLPFDNERKLSLVYWILWLVPSFIYFSFTKGLFHPYYLTMLSAPIAALFGIGVTEMWKLYKEGSKKALILPAALVINGLVQILLLSYSYSTSWIAKALTGAIVILSFLSAAVLIAMHFKKTSDKIRKGILIAAVAGLLISPLVYSSTVLFYKMQGTFPSAGLSLIQSSGKEMGMGGPSMGNSKESGGDSELINYLLAHKGSEKYIVAVSSANQASDIVIQTGQPVMALGGFSGSDNILTLSEFKKLVSEGKVRYAMLGGGGAGGNSEIDSWIQENGKVASYSSKQVTTSETSNSNTSSDTKDRGFGNFRGGRSSQLYDLKDSVK